MPDNKNVFVIDIEKVAQQTADDLFEQAISVVNENGVCYLRFTREDGMVVLHPRYNSKINGVISDA